MTRSKTNNQKIAEEAAEWAVKIDETPLGPVEKAAFAAWIKSSATHVDEFLLASSLLSGVERSNLPLGTILAESEDSSLSNVVPLVEAERQGQHLPQDTHAAETTRLGIRRFVPLAAAAAFLVFATMSVLLFPTGTSERPTAPDTYATETGEQRSLTLADGSIVTLNTQSRITVSLTGSLRTVNIEAGEAFFDVVHEASRPFRVIAGGTVFDVVGTEFNVKFLKDFTELRVADGLVAMSRTARAAPTPGDDPAIGSDRTGTEHTNVPSTKILVAKGEMAVATPGQSAIRVGTADLETLAIWRQRKLVFSDTPLSEVASEFNRYNSRKIALADVALGAERYTGTFDARDPESFIEFLVLSGHAQASYSDTAITITPMAPTG
jgi:transmembrane sensor